MRRVWCAAIWVCALTGGCLAADAALASRPSRQAPPDLASQAKAERLILELFRDAMMNDEPAQRQALAKKLFQHGLDSGDTPAAQFVLLREARDLAVVSGDMATACRAHDALLTQFDLDAEKLTLAMLVSAAAAAKTQNVHLAVAAAALRYAGAAERRSEFAAASRLLGIAQAQAALAKNVAMSGKASARASEIGKILQEQDKVEVSRQALVKNPEDPEANLLLGRHLCFVRAAFEEGLPYLAKASDSDLRRLAADDLNGTADPTRRFEIGDQWWTLAEKQLPLAQRSLRGRAAVHLQAALPSLSGLNRSVAQQRLEMLETIRLEEMGLSRGLIAELFKGILFAESAGRRVDEQINFEWGESAADALLPKDDFSIRWDGLFKVESGGHYELIVQANTGVRLWINDKLLMDRPNLTRLRNGARVTVDLAEGMHPFKIEFWDTSGLARMKLLWQPPGTASPEPVPARLFYHDALSSPASPASPTSPEGSGT